MGIKRSSKGVVISRHTGECVNICLQKLLLCYIILTFKHEKNVWLVLKCIHDIQKKTYKTNNNKKQKNRIQTKSAENYWIFDVSSATQNVIDLNRHK